MYADDDDYNDEIGDVLADRDGYPEPEFACLDCGEAFATEAQINSHINTSTVGHPSYWDNSDEDECPAGGEHTWVDNADEWIGIGPMPHPGIHCDECGVSGTKGEE